MNVDIQRMRFEREFGVIGTNIRVEWFTLYLALRAEGDDHVTASETVRGEMQMSNVQRGRANAE